MHGFFAGMEYTALYRALYRYAYHWFHVKRLYILVHDAVMEGVICGDTKIPVPNIHSAVVKMSKKDPESEMTAFQLHFKVATPPNFLEQNHSIV